MQNFREKTDSAAENMKKHHAAAWVLSAAMAVLIFLGANLVGDYRTQNQDLTVAEGIRAAGDMLTASADTKKVYTQADYKTSGKDEKSGRKITVKKMTESERKQQAMEKRDQQWVENAAETKRELKMVDKVKEVPYSVEERKTSLLPTGKKVVVREGVPGEKILTYRQRIEDGKIIREKQYSAKMGKEPINEIVLIGDSGISGTISPLDFNLKLDEKGIPVNYKNVLNNQVATGYNFGSTARGASGQKLSAGYVAVHPGEIPYGTKLYITSADNSFVYGCAIAADTGVGLLQDMIDIDLYYDTYAESCLNGKRNVNIYIL